MRAGGVGRGGPRPPYLHEAFSLAAGRTGRTGGGELSFMAMCCRQPRRDRVSQPFVNASVERFA
jgi:hypothetical protein